MAEVTLYLPAHLREGHEAGQVNILSRILAALPGWQVTHAPEDAGERQAHRGFAITHMQEPRRPGTLCLRRAYWYPFWRLEPTNERWNFAVARQTPDYSTIPPRAEAFHARLRERVLAGRQVTREGFIFAPLQGRLTEHRSFQSMSPLAMLEETLARQPLPVLASLHPGERYGPQDHAALDRLAQNPRFRLVQSPAAELIAGCDFVVSQNSSVALQAMIAGKGAVLFAGIDFHHPAGSVPRDGLAAAFETGAAPPARMAEYLWWFFKQEAIDAQAEEASARIRARLTAEGWPLPRP
ncbi:MAG: hypothetical protein JNN06_04410 [Gemmobacter sp.]|uniref:hypothetical protein n=1 Tax=Gemmobacter sp. TaxID=1898957 RepID=UPI001A59D399|nr:hypothetical protein [Gemmobacter sp.]MBL8561501.1 hypothetical protein [Gemmobacter sp.]